MTDQHNLDDAELVTVAECDLESTAAIYVSILKDAGIKAVATGGFTAGFRAEAPGLVHVRTLDCDAERAKKILAEVEPLDEAGPSNDGDD